MADTLEIFGTEYIGVTSLKVTDDNNLIKTYVRPTGTLPISTNGTGIDVTNYATVDVAVSSGAPVIQSLSVTPTTSEQTFNSSSVDGYKPIVVAAVTTTNLSASNILNGVTIKVGNSSDDDCIASVTGNVVIQNYYTGSTAPASGTGSNGDLYLRT